MNYKRPFNDTFLFFFSEFNWNSILMQSNIKWKQLSDLSFPAVHILIFTSRKSFMWLRIRTDQMIPIQMEPTQRPIIWDVLRNTSKIWITRHTESVIFFRLFSAYEADIYYNNKTKQ